MEVSGLPLMPKLPPLPGLTLLTSHPEYPRTPWGYTDWWYMVNRPVLDWCYLPANPADRLLDDFRTDFFAVFSSSMMPLGVFWT